MFNRLSIVLILLCLGLLWILLQVVTAGRPARNSDRLDRSSPSTFDVTYIISGDTEAIDVTYRNGQGGTEQQEVRQVVDFNQRQFRIELPDMERGTFVYISAQNGEPGGDVKCRILIDDFQWKESESAGAYKIATCSGAVGEE